MTGNFFLDWSALSVSLFNASLLIWLGLTVALNAERPRERGGRLPGVGWGTPLIAASLLLGGLFFVAHSALLTYDLNTVSAGLNFWWHLGWWPVIALPLAWYVLVLWYSGYWDDPHTALHRRHRLGLWASLAGLLLMLGLVIFANPLPSLGAGIRPDASQPLAVAGLPLLGLAYPVYIFICMSLALDALLRPGPTGRLLGDLARRRARPWLAAGSALLVLVSLLVGWAIVWVLQALNAHPGQPLFIDAGLARAIGWADLLIGGLIAAAALMLGQALVAYEVFTGKTLPRRGLLRYWNNAVVLAAGFALLAGWSLTLHLRPTYIVLLSTGLLSVFYALFSWRSYAERERYMTQLRPFVASQGLYDHLLDQAQARPALTATNGAAAADSDAQGAASAHGAAGSAESAGSSEAAATYATFRALCRDVLDARLAYLIALGTSAPLAGPPLYYENGAPASPPPANLEAVAAQAAASAAPFMAVSLPETPGVHWAVPLRSERRPNTRAGLIGLLLLGDKVSSGLSTQEEIDIARAGGERLLDTLASAELARRLVVLQRQRLAESLLLDRRTRRVLHDDVLPQLHAALLYLHAMPVPADGQEAASPAAEPIRLLAGAHRRLAELLRELPAGPEPEVARLGLFDALRRLAAVEFSQSFDDIAWQIEPAAEEHAARLPGLAAEVMFYAAREAMRNAARHGRRAGAPAALNLIIAAAWAEPSAPPAARGLSLTIEDNGAGLAEQAAPASRAERPGAGQGLALHGTLLAVVGGTLTITSDPGKFTRVVLCLPPEAFGSAA
jgi:signal transduction histidine kinase